MFSADGEFVSFNKPVSLDNPVEVIMTLWFWGGGGLHKYDSCFLSLIAKFSGVTSALAV